MSLFQPHMRRRLLAAGVAVTSLLAYAEQHAWQWSYATPSELAWTPNAPLEATASTQHSRRVAPNIDGVVDVLELSGEKVKGEMVVSDTYHAGLEVAGWMVLPRYRRPFFRPDVVEAILFNEDHEYHFAGNNVERRDIARLFTLPSAHLGFHLRMDLSNVAPGRYTLRVQRYAGQITPNVTVIRT